MIILLLVILIQNARGCPWSFKINNVSWVNSRQPNHTCNNPNTQHHQSQYSIFSDYHPVAGTLRFIGWPVGCDVTEITSKVTSCDYRSLHWIDWRNNSIEKQNRILENRLLLTLSIWTKLYSFNSKQLTASLWFSSE